MSFEADDAERVRALAYYFPPTSVFEVMRRIVVYETPLSDLVVDL